jgi:hypothetical protein
MCTGFLCTVTAFSTSGRGSLRKFHLISTSFPYSASDGRKKRTNAYEDRIHLTHHSTNTAAIPYLSIVSLALQYARSVPPLNKSCNRIHQLSYPNDDVWLGGLMPLQSAHLISYTSSSLAKPPSSSGILLVRLTMYINPFLVANFPLCRSVLPAYLVMRDMARPRGFVWVLSASFSCKERRVKADALGGER